MFIFQPLGMFSHVSITFELDLQYSPPGRRHKRQWAREGWKPAEVAVASWKTEISGEKSSWLQLEDHEI
jgi:hypothetical protein